MCRNMRYYLIGLSRRLRLCTVRLVALLCAQLLIVFGFSEFFLTQLKYFYFLQLSLLTPPTRIFFNNDNLSSLKPDLESLCHSF